MLSLFRFGTELLGKLPARGDGIAGTLVKGLAIADAWEGVYGGKSSVYTSIFSRYDLRERTSEPFVKLFFGTSLGSSYKVRRIGVSEHLEMIEAVASDGERLFFQEHRYGRPEVSSEFFHTPRFDFAGVMSVLWDKYRDGLYLSLVPGRHGYGHEVTFCGLSADPTVGRSRKAADRITALAESLSKAPRTLLLYGPPGTGKTSLVSGVARLAGGRLLKIDAASLPQIGVQELGFLLEALRPRFLLIDDYDRAPVDEARARLLFMFERLKTMGPSVFVTVNDVTKLDQALLRSGRIDEAIELGLPDGEERADILGRLGLGLDLVQATEGFNHADLDALAQRSSGTSVASALAGMQRLRALAQQVAAAGGTPAEGKGAAPTP
ncbi:AAA family ATPase [Sorangium sp. So ce388]|uniref:AAA family ATPase n=1 Tax=Sorangium sp. So ce388 TaxID=3133309 RepID=UPI003F5C2D34